MKYIASLILLSWAFASCRDEVDLDLKTSLPVRARLSVADMQSPLQRAIVADAANFHFGKYDSGSPTRAVSQMRIYPYIQKTDTVMYILQYDEGWDIYSGSLNSPMLLFSSAKGDFMEDFDSFPDGLRCLIEGCADNLETLGADKASVASENTWKAYMPDYTDDASVIICQTYVNGIAVNISDDDLPPGHWELWQSSTLSNETVVSPKLTQTKWGQMDPWNQYAKWAIDPNGILMQCPVGCSSVAVSQYLYYTNRKDGVPTHAPGRASLSNDGRDYTFSDFRDDVWDKMAHTSAQTGANWVALLMGYVGRQLGSHYTTSGTGTLPYRCAEFLTSVYGEPFSMVEYTSFAVLRSIDEHYPVVTHARRYIDENRKATEGHAFIIDRYKKIVTTTRTVYAWVRDPSPEGVEDVWMKDFVDQAGNIVRYAYTKEVVATAERPLAVSMNWGWNGSYDEVFYSAMGAWSPGNSNYNLNHMIDVPVSSYAKD